MNRWKAIAFSTAQYQLSRKFPNYMRKTLLTMAKRRLPEGYDVDKHFGPDYKPWDQRLCLAPNGDLFKTIRKGQADVVTDTIDRFTKTGIMLRSGTELQADIIITATGLNMQLVGGVKPSRNGEPIDLTSLMTYKGLMFSGVPNFAITFGYTNASWTLKADLVSEFVCRLLNYMDANGFDTVEPQHPGDAVDELPFMDFNPGYFQRSMHLLPKSGSRAPWRLKQNYFMDLQLIRRGKVDDEALHFAKKPAALAVCLAPAAATTTMPSSSLYAMSPGTNSTPPKLTVTSRSPAPVLSLLRGLVPSALMPISMPLRAAASRTAPCTINPAQSLERANSAMRSPTSAVCNEAPPSITSTPPSPGVDSTDFSRALSAAQRTVLIGPANSVRAPNCRNWTSQLRTSEPMSSTRSAVGRNVTVTGPR